MKRELFTPDRLMSPGPTPVPEIARIAAGKTALYHRSDEYYELFKNCRKQLAPLFGSRNEPLILTASGSGAMEAAMTNLTQSGDQVVVVNGGKFGQRWEKLAEAYGCKTEVVNIEWGSAPKVEEILAALSRLEQPRAVFFQANETSTGAYYPIEELMGGLRSQFDGLVIVDAISALCAHPMKMDEWQIDCVISGSQKGFGVPPGLAFIALSDKAWGALSNRPRFYFDLQKERQGQDQGRSAYTSATTLVLALHAALAQIHEAGLDTLTTHHARLGKACRKAVTAMGLELFARDCPSNALTSAKIPKPVNGSRLLQRLREKYGYFFAGGQDHLKGKIVRISHLGFVSRFDLLDGLAALEFSLAEEGHEAPLGCGVQAAMQLMASDLE